MGVSRARVSRMEHGDIERMQVESAASYVTAIGGHLRLVADFDQATTTFIDYTDGSPPEPPRSRARHTGSGRVTPSDAAGSGWP